MLMQVSASPLSDCYSKVVNLRLKSIETLYHLDISQELKTHIKVDLSF